MKQQQGQVCVFYDGSCPKCIKDRQRYEKIAGKNAGNVRWFDITGQEKKLQELGIDPAKALTELHLQDENKHIVSELDAYILLMSKVPILRPIAWLIGLPVIRPILARIYHRQVEQRLYKSGRL